ncbi:MAG: hypothetical protein MK089_09650 [Phycisphaerales bacterium]|nr:hypothetical protein [Phycisphaerales bacterium]
MTSQTKLVPEHKAQTALCVIALIASVVTVLAVASALAVRLLQLGDAEDPGSFPFNLLHMESHDEAMEADHANRFRLWSLAISSLVLAIGSAVLALAASRSRSLTVSLLLIACGAGTCVVAFLLASPLGLISAIIPLIGVIVLIMKLARGT